MAEESDFSYDPAQTSLMADYTSFGGAAQSDDEGTESDEYDPTAIIQDDSSVRVDTSEQNSTTLLHSTLMSPVAQGLHPLPPRPDTGSPAVAQYSPTINQPHESTSTAPLPPKMMGGFEIDDDDLEAEEENDDSKDVLDIYDSVDGNDGNVASPAPEISTDSDPSSAKQVNGAAFAAYSQGAVNGASDVVSSPAVSTVALPQRATTATPMQMTADIQAQASSIPQSMNASLPVAAPKARLAHDIIGILEDRIKDDSRGDIAAWLQLIDELKSRNKQEEVRQVYERFLRVFPLAADQWCAYIRWEEENDRKWEMEKLFSRSLLEIPDVQLWSIYINYIRRRNSMQTGDISKSYKIIYDAFTFALNNVGMDKDSGKLWQDYIEFIKSGPGIIGGTGWQDNSKMDSLRAAYQRAIAVPTSALNSLWKEYDAFETGLSKINGRKFLQERSPAYMTARSSYTQLQNMTRELRRTSRPQLPPAPGFDGDSDFAHQVFIWKEWIRWEKDDNLVLGDEDATGLRNRILFTYKQALMALQYWPEMWYDAAEYCFLAGVDDNGTKFLVQGIAANPESCLLAFKLADRIEVSTTSDDSSDPGSKQRMAKVREPYDKALDALYEVLSRTKDRENRDIQKIEQSLIESTASEANGVAGVTDYNGHDDEAAKQAVQAQIDSVKAYAYAQTEMLKKTISYAWVALMRAARRVQGKGLPTERGGGFRAVFADSRKKGKITSDVYVENALIEYHCYKDPAGTKIFERGMKLFPEDERFTLEYLKHLVAINDITNARAVFETTVTKLTANPATKDKAMSLFVYFHEYESHFGELPQIRRLENRMAELFPDDIGLRQFAQRFNSATFDPTAVIPVVSSQQVRPKILLHPSIEAQPEAVNSPITRLIDSINTNSPKRPFPDDGFEDPQPRKLARGESPLKGAAGRRMNQQQQQRQVNGLPAAPTHMPIPPPLPNQLTYLLSVFPKASLYVDTRFDAGRMVELIRTTHLPPAIPPPHHQAPVPQPPVWQQPQQSYPSQQPPMMPPGYLPPGIAPAQYGTPFRYA